VQKRISVIIGAYNAEPFIQRCVDSIVQQEQFPMDDLEIILCNDGSEDNTLAVMQEYQRQYPGVVSVDTHENIKPAKTKNRAIEMATGKYIIFLDADDWLERDFCNRFYIEIERSGADVVFGGYKRVSQTGDVLKVATPSLCEYAKYMFVVSTMRIHRREHMMKHAIKFTESTYGEDILFSVKQIAAGAVFKPILYAGYNYLYNTDSITNTTQKGFDEANLKTVKNLLEQIIKIGEPLKNEPSFQYYLVRTVVFNLLYSGRNSSSQQFIVAYKQLFSLLNLRVPEMQYTMIAPKGETLSVRFIIFLFLLFRRLRVVHLFSKVYCR